MKVALHFGVVFSCLARLGQLLEDQLDLAGEGLDVIPDQRSRVGARRWTDWET